MQNAAEKAWGATKRATGTLILARTGREPRTTRQTLPGIRQLFREHPEFQQLQLQYRYRSQIPHGSCFYHGICEPEDVLAQDVRDTFDYIRDAEGLADK